MKKKIRLLIAVGALLTSPSICAEDISPYQAKDFSYLLGMKGLSNKLLQQHFALYQGYVKQTNTMSALLVEALEKNPFSPLEYSSLKKCFSFEYNGMKLHELFFSNLTKTKKNLNTGELLTQINQDFGSFESWLSEISKTALTRGIGWVVCYFDKTQNRLFTAWVESHEKGNLEASEAILVIDLWEHAYINDYGIQRQEYMNAILSSIDWDVVEERFKKATKNN